MGAFVFERHPAGIGTLTFDLPGEKVNKLSAVVLNELDSKLNELATETALTVLMIRSAKPGIFIAGADIAEIELIKDAKEGELKAGMGQGILTKLSRLPFPTIAVIEGAALGGGLELALACTFRVANDHPRTQLGLPEVNLGILPGFGGTQRLPKLIGLQDAIPMVTSGKFVDGKKAKKIGLVDAYFTEAFFEESLAGFVSEVRLGKRKSKSGIRRRFRGLLDWMLERTFFGRFMVFRTAMAQVKLATKGHYPAPVLALKAIKYGYCRGLQKGLDREAKLFGELVGTSTCRHLIRLFYVQEALKKDSGVLGPVSVRPMTRFGVLGAGLMGGGIAWLLGYRAGSVRLKDVVWPSIAKGLKTAHDIYLELVKKRKVTTQEVSMMMHRLSGGLDWVGFANTDVVIEAIVEDMTIKKTVLQELEAEVSDTTIIASNTSGLSITEMGSVLSRPDRFIGMHFFSPVHRMPLVEVIRGEQTSDETVAHIVALSKQLKKTPIVVKNGPGFLVNRILIPYVNEAVRLLEDGVDVERIDCLATSFGMPIGPLALADEVGLDVGYKVAKQLEVGYGDRMSVASSFEAIHRVQGMLGKKTGRGFYVHSGKSKRPNDQLASMIVKNFSAQVTDEECIDRLILVMVNESARCLDERVVDNPSYLDMAMILGTGFPAFRGGVTRYADERGLSTIEDALRRLSVKFGKRFEPAPLISQLVAGGRGFEDWAVSQKENR